MTHATALSVEKITVYPNRLVIVVQCAPNWHYTNPHLARQIAEKFPLIGQHACVNEQGPCFSAVMQHTPLPHLFEHVVVDILVQQATCEQNVFMGTSEWTDRPAGKACVHISFENDLAAIAAVKQAQECINELCTVCV